MNGIGRTIRSMIKAWLEDLGVTSDEAEEEAKDLWSELQYQAISDQTTEELISKIRQHKSG